MPLRQRLLTFPAGRRSKWAVLFFWLAVMGVVLGADLPTKFDDAQKNESTSFLPGDAESTKALQASERIQGDEIAPIAIVYQRDGGLTPADFDRIEADRSELNADLFPRTTEYTEPFTSADAAAAGGAEPPQGDAKPDAAIIQSDISSDGESETITDPVEQARDQVADPPDGLTTAVAGGAALSADAIDVFEQIDGALLFTTGLIVLILLLAVYRSPVFWIFPFLAVIFAELTARGLGYGLTEIGVTLNGQSAGIMPVLVFGAGTDYALLLVARYREELRREDDKHEAMAIALRQAGPAILASGLTVIAALLCLTIADVEGTAGLGPIGAMGIAVAMVAMLTALPAFLVIPRGFWLGFLGVIVGMIFGAVIGVPPVGLRGRPGADRRSPTGSRRTAPRTRAGSSGRSSPTSATRHPTRPTASGAEWAIASRSARVRSGLPRSLCSWSSPSAGSTSTSASPRATSSAATSNRSRRRSCSPRRSRPEPALRPR